ncbi:MarR family transcriptional regulator [Epibacterium ulvae]|uniref:MarR family winged helix-turn-helix transcriptional regulator n=1 Tax=Epibacterium ulvae TaxID=1156985 RepID=UPI001BFC1511|nr:MarR family transcriptional regulator [Epibacterium ulvae]MBT8155759.1 MarR family transcriptional regulator [Epibacterium ulvae]
MPKEPSPVNSFITYSLAAAHQRLHRKIGKRLKSLGMQIETWRVLQSLRTDDTYTMSELAEVVLMNPPALSKLVDRMIADGLVQRQLVPEDQRQVRLLLTDLGVSIANEITGYVNEQEDRILDLIGHERADFLKKALDTLN